MYLCLPLLLPFLRMCVELHCGHWIAKPLYPSFYYATPLGMVLAPSFGIGIVFYTFWTMCYTLFIVTTISLRQIVTPDRLQSRVNASARLIAWGGQPFGAAVGGLVAEATTVRIAYLVVGMGVVVSAAAGWFSSLREGEKVPQKPDCVTKISQD